MFKKGGGGLARRKFSQNLASTGQEAQFIENNNSAQTRSNGPSRKIHSDDEGRGAKEKPAHRKRS